MTPGTLSGLPPPAVLKRKAKALAILDAIYCQEWEMRYFSHDAQWGPDEELSSMRDGEGDDYFVLFAPYGTAIKGCQQESQLAGNRAHLATIRKHVPARFADFMAEPAFSIDEASFVLWFDETQGRWNSAVSSTGDDDGQNDLLQWLTRGPDFYLSWAEQYYERIIHPELVELAFDHQPISLALIESLNIPIERDALIADFEEIDYPYQAD